MKCMKKAKSFMTGLLTFLLFATLLSGCADVKATAATSAESSAAAISTTAASTAADTAVSSETTAAAVTEPTATPSPIPNEPVLPDTELIISAAASLTGVCGSLTDLFAKEQPQVTLTFNFGASGALQEQIENGAPADLFISAGVKQMKALTDGGFMVDDTLVDLLENEVALVVPAGSEAGITSFEDAATDKVITLALGDPDSVPAGQYAAQVFESLGITDDVSPKIVYGKDVRQILTYIENGEVDAGVIFVTDAYSSDKVTIAATAPAGSHTAVIYPAGIVKASENQAAAQIFLDFLSTPEAAAVFESYGFIMAG